MPKAMIEPENCDPSEVAGWIGLADSSRLGTEPIALPAGTVERLRKHGTRVELTAHEAAAVLRVDTKSVHLYTRPKTKNGSPRHVVLGRRVAVGRRVLILASDLATFIERSAEAAVPTTGTRPRVNEAAAKRVAADCREEFSLPRS